jgi:Ca2+-binding RTX toxin-like protein
VTISRVAFIDSRVAHYQLIVAALPDGTDWFLINADEDGLSQMARVLSGYSGLQTIDVISHGSAGALTLGSSVVAAASLDDQSAQLHLIGASLASHGDILLYGCDVGAGAAGQTFVDQFAVLTGADVAASTNVTGESGDWVLESASGVVAPAALELSMYPGSLDTITGTAGDDYVSGGDGSDSLLGGDGNDRMWGNGGADTVVGGGGADEMYGGNGGGVLEDLGDSLFGEVGNDYLGGEGGDDTLDGGLDDDYLSGGDGSDSLLGGDGNDRMWGNQGTDTVVGGGGADEIYGGNGGGVLEDLGDVLFGEAGNDYLSGEGGDDTLDGGLDHDYVSGGDGSDSLLGGDGSDRMWGNGGADTVVGGAGADEMYGGNGGGVLEDLGDVLFGEVGNDYLGGEGGDDTLDGGLDDDYLSGGDGSDSLLGGDGNDRIWGNQGADVIIGGAGNDQLYGGHNGGEQMEDDHDSIAGGEGNDFLRGEGGNDTLDGGSGDDFLDGGSGDDVFIVDDAGDVISELTDEGVDRVESSVNWTLSANVEQLILSGNNALSGTGNSNANTLTGNSSSNTLNGGAGADTLNGGAGDDIYLVDDAGDVVTELTGEGTDRVESITSWTLSANIEQLTLTGTSALTGAGNASTNTISGNSEDNSLQGLSGNDTLIGGSGNDTLDGGAGTDTVTYNSLMAGYRFSATATGDFVVADTDTVAGGNDGTDTLNGIERIVFSDGVVTVRQYAETRVNATTAGDQTGPAVTALADGGYVVTWESGDGSGYGVYAQRYGADGSAIGAETRINTTTSNDQYQSAITALTDGGYVVAWTSVDGSGYGVVSVQRYDASGLAVGSEARHITDLYWLPDQGTPAITGLADGGYVVTWTNSGQGYDWILSQRYSPDGAAVGSPNNVDEGSPYPRVNQTITALADGGYVVTWSADYLYFNDGSLAEIFVRRFSASGTAVGAEARINTTTAGNQGSPAIAGLEDGGYVVTWTSDSDIYAQRYAASGAAVGPETRINTTTADSQFNPAITALADGGYVVMWEGVDDSGYGVYAQRYGANGSAVGAETRINTTTANGQGTPAVTALPDGGYVVAWMSDNQDGSGYGVYTQRFDASGGTVKLTGDSAANTVTWSANTSIAIDGSGGNDTLTGGDAPDLLQGGLGNDSLSGGLGNDTLQGGAGNDTYVVDNTADRIQEDAGKGSDTVKASVDYTLSANVEHLTLTGSANLSATGNDLSNRITGNAGANTLDGGAGADTLGGGSGDDIYYVDNAADSVVEGAAKGKDTVRSSVNITLAANVENLNLSGAATTGTGNDQANLISGTDTANTLRGAGGSDTLVGGAGDDTLVGGAGNDTYVLDSAADVVTEGAGAGKDLVRSSADVTLSANVENLTLLDGALNGQGNGLANVITGNAAANRLVGAAGDDTLVGGGSADTMNGGAGDDSYTVTLGDETVELAGGGTDTVNSAIAWTLAGQVENLLLTGGGGVAGTGNAIGNLLRGNTGNNTLDGRDGADTLAGGAGNDTLTGGAGADVFLFDTTPNATTNRDLVNDFVSGTDQIHLDVDVFSALVAGAALTEAQFRSGAGFTTAQTSDHRIIYNTSTGALFYDPDGVDGVAAVRFAVLGSTTHPALGFGDFVITG